jgi:hypothetical protein
VSVIRGSTVLTAAIIKPISRYNRCSFRGRKWCIDEQSNLNCIGELVVSLKRGHTHTHTHTHHIAVAMMKKMRVWIMQIMFGEELKILFQLANSQARAYNHEENY